VNLPIKIYRNEDVEEVVVAIPRNHRHVRVLIKLRDQGIVLQEASVAAIARAYLSVLLHPSRRGIILKNARISERERKPGYAEYQLIEIPNSEEEAVNIMTSIVSSGESI